MKIAESNYNIINMTSSHPDHGRPTSKDPIKIFHRDQSTLHQWSPDYASYHKFGEITAKYHTLFESMNWEEQEKYLNKYQARFKAKVELRSMAYCFGKCTETIDDTDLSSNEKNCMRECYFRRVNARDDMHFMFQQYLTSAKIEQTKLDFI
jgi:hypothetical protein